MAEGGKSIPWETGAGIALILVGAVLMFVIKDYPDMAREFPSLLLVAIIGVSGFSLLFERWRHRHGAPPIGGAAGARAAREAPSFPDGGNRRVVLVIFLMFAFFALFLAFGFVASVAIFMVAAPWALGFREPKVLLVSSLLTTVFLYVVFVVFMGSYFGDSWVVELLRSD